MNRRSLGADIYSPIRFDTSFNDSLNADGSISEYYRGHAFKVDCENSSESIENKDLFKPKSEKVVKTPKGSNKKSSSNVFSRKNDVLSLPCCTEGGSVSNVSDNVFTTSPANDVIMHPEIMEKEQVTKRRSTRKSGKDEKEKQAKDRSAAKKSVKKDLAPGKFITMRSEQRRISCKSTVNILPSHSEALEDLNIDISTTASASLVSDESKTKSSSLGTPELGANSELLGISSTTNIDCATQTDLNLTDLQNLMLKIDLAKGQRKEVPLTYLGINSGSTFNAVKESSEPSSEGSVNQSTQIQANIIEKLVKDTVSSEFDGIRQILYLQHMSIGKLLYKNMEVAENQNAGLIESLNKIIEELLKENQQLRNAVIAHQYSS